MSAPNSISRRIVGFIIIGLVLTLIGVLFYRYLTRTLNSEKSVSNKQVIQEQNPVINPTSSTINEKKIENKVTSEEVTAAVKNSLWSLQKNDVFLGINRLQKSEPGSEYGSGYLGTHKIITFYITIINNSRTVIHIPASFGFRWIQARTTGPNVLSGSIIFPENAEQFINPGKSFEGEVNSDPIPNYVTSIHFFLNTTGTNKNFQMGAEVPGLLVIKNLDLQ